MSRSLPRRRRRNSGGRLSVTPLMVFLLIACFGIFFAGCSSNVSIKGPTQEEMSDVSFTADDIARFRELAAASSAMSEGSSVPELSVSSAQMPDVGGGAPDLDRSMVATYRGLRQAPATAGENQYVVSNSVANLREAPSVGARLVRVLTGGTSVIVLKWENGEWAQVEIPGGEKGFVSVKYLAKPVTQEDLAAKQKYFENMYFVSFQFVNVRSAPNQQGEKLGEIPGKLIVTVKSVENGWATIDFNGKQGYVSMDYLTKFSPAFQVRQGTYSVPVLRYSITDDAALTQLIQHLTALRGKGIRILSFRTFRQMLLDQDKSGTPVSAKNVLIAITNVNVENARKISDALTSNNFGATLFIETKNLGVSGITQKTMLTLSANGLDIQSGGHTGDDLRALTNAQVRLEVEQSRKLIEDATSKPVFAIFFPQGGANDRVEQLAEDAGYLFGIQGSGGKTFTRADLLHLPSVPVTSTTPVEDILTLFP